MGRLSNAFSRLLNLRNGSYQDRDGWFYSWLTGGGNGLSGESMSERKAMAIIAYYACVRNISQDIAAMPRGIYKRLTRGRVEIPEHQVSRLLNESPNERDDQVSYCLFETWIAHACAYHGGYCEIVRDNGGRIVGLHNLDPTSVSVKRSNAGQIFYEIGPNKIMLDPGSVLHLHGLGFDGVTGYIHSVLLKDGLSAARATQRFRAAFFGNAATPTGVLQTPNSLTDPAMQHLRESFEERHSGPENAFKPLILEEGLTWQTISPDPQKAMMIEASYLDIENCCRALRMPPHKLQHLNKGGASFASVYEANLDYGTDTLTPWIVQAEQEINKKLLRNEKDLYCKFSMDSRLRADPEKRANSMKALFDMGMLTPNEGRALNDVNPSTDQGADSLFVNQAYIPLDLLWKLKLSELESTNNTDSDIPEQSEGETDTSQGYDEDEEKIRNIVYAFKPLLADAIRTQLNIEYDRAVRASKRDSMQEWAQSFYAGTNGIGSGEFRARVGMILGSIAGAIGCDSKITADYLLSLEKRHGRESLQEIENARAVMDIDHWRSTRPDIEASREIEYLVSALRASK